MKNPSCKIALRTASLAVAVATLAGCNALDRLSRVGAEPELKPIENPVDEPDYEPVTMPMPRPEQASYQPNSLWRTGTRAFFKDQRAHDIGDILTVKIEIDDDASLSNSTEQARSTGENADVSALFGYEQSFDKVLPEAIDPTNLLDINSDREIKGAGSVDRGEQINLKVAAIVTQVLPNRNLVIRGRQEVRVNYEVRELWITGVVRPEDITSTNTIDYEKIAEARIAYGGRGVLSDVQQPRYGAQILDIIYPF